MGVKCFALMQAHLSVNLWLSAIGFFFGVWQLSVVKSQRHEVIARQRRPKVKAKCRPFPFTFSANRKSFRMNKFLLFVAVLFTTVIEAAPIRVLVWDENGKGETAYTNFIAPQIASFLKTLPNLDVKSGGLN